MLTITIDGLEVTLTGTTKGDRAQADALSGTAWRWSRTAGAWVLPRNLREATRRANIDRFKRAAEAAGIDIEVVDTGVTLTVAQERAAERERLEARADRLDGYAERQAAESAAAEAAGRKLRDSIPFGQPVLVGHHSQARAERDIAKIDRLARKEIDADREAREAARLAEGLHRHLAAGPATPTLIGRIERNEAELRALERQIENRTGTVPEHWTEETVRLAESIELDKAELARRQAEDGVKVWGPDDFTKGDLVQIRGRWHVVQRVNKKTLTVPSSLGSWSDTVPYAKVTGQRPAADA